MDKWLLGLTVLPFLAGWQCHKFYLRGLHKSVKVARRKMIGR